MDTIDLNGKWIFRVVRRSRRVSGGRPDLERWMTARVPGTVHTDLLANGEISDPFQGMNEQRVQWIDLQQWIYRRGFRVSRQFLRHRVVELVTEGLDTVAEVRCNGKRVGKASNMFCSYRFNVRSALKEGRNTLEVLFDSPTRRAKALEQLYGRLQVGLESHRVYLRKAQYSFGWDWGPKLTTSGIWRPIRLEGYSVGRLSHPHVEVLSAGEREAIVRVSVDVHRVSRGPMQLDVSLAGEDTRIQRSVPVRSASVALRFVVENPRLWWPHGYGEQSMYSITLSLVSKAGMADSVRVPFGIRTVRLVQEPDREGRSFMFEINGRKIFCKGADWIPCDNFLPRVRRATYERLLTLARDASMNMIRVWGGGIYEQDVFYDLCDRLGLMVWQDFMYACGEYPDHKSFLTEARHEAEQVVKLLRNHPSIVLWCGNNECEWIYCMANPTKGVDDMRGAAIFREVLPAVVRAYDRSRPYWRSTPFGKGFPNSETNGNHHQWEVWSRWKDYKAYEKVHARFITEFGFQAPANRQTLERVIPSAERFPLSAAMEHHNKQVEGPERLYRFQASHFRIATGWAEFIYKCQLVQAEALRFAAEHWRRRKFRTAGVLFWQLNDCWPVSSWSVIDSQLRPKAAYFYAKRFFAPVLISFRRVGLGIEVWGTNDTLRPLAGKLVVSLRSFTGRTQWKRSFSVKIPSNASRVLHLLPSIVDSGIDVRQCYLHAQLFEGNEVLCENRHLFLEPKHLSLPRARVNCRVVRVGSGDYCFVLTAGAFAKDVCIETSRGSLELDDNYFDLDPGSSRVVYGRSGLSPAELKHYVGVVALNS